MNSYNSFDNDVTTDLLVEVQQKKKTWILHIFV